jgi:hypothetical protein
MEVVLYSFLCLSVVVVDFCSQLLVLHTPLAFSNIELQVVNYILCNFWGRNILDVMANMGEFSSIIWYS